jgi:PncC family amidohydrolase
MNADIDRITSHMVRNLNGRTIGCAESVTAGRIAARVACIEHAVDFFRGGVVAYQTAVKRSLLRVTATNVLSVQAASEMAFGVSHLLGVDAAVATTGLAGGDPEHGVTVGTVFIGTIVDGVSSAHSYRFFGEPDEVCDAATKQALVDLTTALARHHSTKDDASGTETSRSTERDSNASSTITSAGAASATAATAH